MTAGWLRRRHRGPGAPAGLRGGAQVADVAGSAGRRAILDSWLGVWAGRVGARGAACALAAPRPASPASPPGFGAGAGHEFAGAVAGGRLAARLLARPHRAALRGCHRGGSAARARIGSWDACLQDSARPPPVRPDCIARRCPGAPALLAIRRRACPSCTAKRSSYPPPGRPADAGVGVDGGRYRPAGAAGPSRLRAPALGRLVRRGEGRRAGSRGGAGAVHTCRRGGGAAAAPGCPAGCCRASRCRLLGVHLLGACAPTVMQRRPGGGGRGGCTHLP